MKLLVLSVGFSGVEKQVINHLKAAGVEVKVIEMKKFYSIWFFSIISTFRLSFSVKKWIQRAETKYNNYHGSPKAFAMKSNWIVKKVKSELANYNNVLQISGTFSLDALKATDNFNYYILTDYTKALRKTEVLNNEKRRWMAVEKSLYNAADGIFVPSGYIKDSLLNDYAIDSNKTHVIGYGSKYPIVNNIKTKRNNILFVGNDFERKGGLQLLDVFKALQKNIKDLEFTIVGPRFNPAPNLAGINYLGQVSSAEELSIIYSEATLFVLHPESEPFGLVFLEAMSHGIPCVGTELDAMPELIVSTGAGKVVNVNDKTALNDVLHDLICNEEEWERYSENGKAAVTNFYNWKSVVDKIVIELWQEKHSNGNEHAN